MAVGGNTAVGPIAAPKPGSGGGQAGGSTSRIPSFGGYGSSEPNAQLDSGAHCGARVSIVFSMRLARMSVCHSNRHATRNSAIFSQ